MAIGNPRIHAICGLCGCNKRFSFHIDPTGSCGEDGVEYPAVHITCGNCGSLTSLDEIMEEEPTP